MGLDVGIGTGTESLMSATTPAPVGNAAVASGTFTAADAVVAAPDGSGTPISGSSTAGSIVSLAVPNGMSASTFLVKALTAGTVYFEGSVNSTNGTDGDWIDLKQRRTGTPVGTETVDFKTTSAGYFRGNCSGFTYLRARLVGGFTGTPTALIRVNSEAGAVFLNSGIPAGSSTIGTVGAQSILQTQVTGTLTTATASATGTTSTTATVVAPVSSAGNATITVAGATTGTSVVAFEQSDDSGTTWGPLQMVRSNDGNIVITESIAAGLSARFYDAATEGITHIRVRCSTAPATGGLAVRITPGGFLAEPMVSAILQVPQNQQIDSLGTPRPMQFAAANVSTAQTGVSLVAAPGANLAIRVVSYMVTVGAAMNVSLIGAPTTILLPFTANGGISFPGTLQGPAFQVATNTALTWTTSAAGQATIHLSYVIV